MATFQQLAKGNQYVKQTPSGFSSIDKGFSSAGGSIPSSYDASKGQTKYGNVSKASGGGGSSTSNNSPNPTPSPPKTVEEVQKEENTKIFQEINQPNISDQRKNTIILGRKKFVSNEGQYVNEQGLGMSVAPIIVQRQQELSKNQGTIFYDTYGKGFSSNPDIVVTNIQSNPYGQRVTYGSGRSQILPTGLVDIYGKQVSVEDKALKSQKVSPVSKSSLFRGATNVALRVYKTSAQREEGLKNFNAAFDKYRRKGDELINSYNELGISLSSAQRQSLQVKRERLDDLDVRQFTVPNSNNVGLKSFVGAPNKESFIVSRTISGKESISPKVSTFVRLNKNYTKYETVNTPLFKNFDKASFNTLTSVSKGGLYAFNTGLGITQLGVNAINKPVETGAAIGGGLLVIGSNLKQDFNSLRGDYGYLPYTTGYLFKEGREIQRVGALKPVVDFIVFDKALKSVKPVTVRANNAFLNFRAKFDSDFVKLSDVEFGGAYKGIEPVDAFSDFSYGKNVNKKLASLEGKNVAFAHVTSNELKFDVNNQLLIQRAVPKVEASSKSFNLPFNTKFVVTEGGGENLLQLGGVNTRRAGLEEVNLYLAPEKIAPELDVLKTNNVLVKDLYGNVGNQNVNIFNVKQKGVGQAYTKYAFGDESYGYKFSLLPSKPQIYYGVANVGKTVRLNTELESSLFLNKFAEGNKIFVSPENVFGKSSEFQLVAVAERTLINKKSKNPDININPLIVKNNYLSTGNVDKAVSKGFFDKLGLEESSIVVPESKYSLIKTKINNPFEARLENIRLAQSSRGKPNSFKRDFLKVTGNVQKPFLNIGAGAFEATMPKNKVARVGLTEVFFSPSEVVGEVKDLSTGKRFEVSSRELATTNNVKKLLEDKRSNIFVSELKTPSLRSSVVDLRTSVSPLRFSVSSGLGKFKGFSVPVSSSKSSSKSFSRVGSSLSSSLSRSFSSLSSSISSSSSKSSSRSSSLSSSLSRSFSKSSSLSSSRSSALSSSYSSIGSSLLSSSSSSIGSSTRKFVNNNKGLKLKSKSSIGGRKSRNIYSYSPTVEAELFNVKKSNVSPKLFRTGLVLRPIKVGGM